MIDALMYDDSSARHASLAGSHERRECGAVDCRLEICVIEDYNGCLETCEMGCLLDNDNGIKIPCLRAPPCTVQRLNQL